MIKLRSTGQYKTRRTIYYKVYTRVQTFHNERKENSKYTVWKSKVVVDLQKVLSFFIENDWQKLFHKLTTQRVNKNAVQSTRQNLEQQSITHQNTYKIT